MSSTERLNVLGEFLKTRRMELQPELVGLPAPSGPRRRVKGLRREEVAALASISPDSYARIEQGRRSAPWPTLDAITRVLRLDDAGREYLYELSREGRRAGRGSAGRRRCGFTFGGSAGRSDRDPPSPLAVGWTSLRGTRSRPPARTDSAWAASGPACVSRALAELLPVGGGEAAQLEKPRGQRPGHAQYTNRGRHGSNAPLHPAGACCGFALRDAGGRRATYSQGIDLASYGDHPSVRTVFGYLQIQGRSTTVLHCPARWVLAPSPAPFHAVVAPANDAEVSRMA